MLSLFDFRLRSNRFPNAEWVTSSFFIKIKQYVRRIITIKRPEDRITITTLQVSCITDILLLNLPNLFTFLFGTLVEKQESLKAFTPSQMFFWVLGACLAIPFLTFYALKLFTGVLITLISLPIAIPTIGIMHCYTLFTLKPDHHRLIHTALGHFIDVNPQVTNTIRASFETKSPLALFKQWLRTLSFDKDITRKLNIGDNILETKRDHDDLRARIFIKNTHSSTFVQEDSSIQLKFYQSSIPSYMSFFKNQNEAPSSSFYPLDQYDRDSFELTLTPNDKTLLTCLYALIVLNVDGLAHTLEANGTLDCMLLMIKSMYHYQAYTENMAKPISSKIIPEDALLNHVSPFLPECFQTKLISNDYHKHYRTVIHPPKELDVLVTEENCASWLWNA